MCWLGSVGQDCDSKRYRLIARVIREEDCFRTHKGRSPSL